MRSMMKKLRDDPAAWLNELEAEFTPRFMRSSNAFEPASSRGAIWNEYDLRPPTPSRSLNVCLEFRESRST